MNSDQVSVKEAREKRAVVLLPPLADGNVRLATRQPRDDGQRLSRQQLTQVVNRSVSGLDRSSSSSFLHLTYFTLLNEADAIRLAPEPAPHAVVDGGGLSLLKLENPALSAHSIKRGAITHLLDRGAPLEFVSRLAKHAAGASLPWESFDSFGLPGPFQKALTSSLEIAYPASAEEQRCESNEGEIDFSLPSWIQDARNGKGVKKIQVLGLRRDVRTFG
jgi:hypothetical protein